MDGDKCFKADHSISVPSDTIPFSFIRLIQSITSAAPTSTFLGSQPRKGQVPPKGLESTTATSRPAERYLYAAVEAAAPVPITTRSNLLVIACPLSGPSYRFTQEQPLGYSSSVFSQS